MKLNTIWNTRYLDFPITSDNKMLLPSLPHVFHIVWFSWKASFLHKPNTCWAEWEQIQSDTKRSVTCAVYFLYSLHETKSYYEYVSLFRYHDYVQISWLCSDIMTMFRYHDYVQISWLCSDIMTLFRYHDSVQISWLCSDIMTMFRYHDSVQISWLCSDIMTLFRYHDYVQISWLCSDIMTIFRYHDYVQISWLCSDIMTMFRYHDYVQISWQGVQCSFIRISYTILLYGGHAVAQSVETLRYKAEGRGFDSRWCHWNFSLT